jgi:hypothetical protein
MAKTYSKPTSSGATNTLDGRTVGPLAALAPRCAPGRAVRHFPQVNSSVIH